MRALFSTGMQKAALYADLVKFEHTIFALPFALSAMILAQPHGWPHVITVVWVILAMVGGRTYAMGLNRIIDARIDGQNPRTQLRALPAGRIRRAEAWALTLLSLCLMILATLQLPLLCLELLPVAVAILTVYSYVKRFSSLAHLVLGLALGSSAIGGWIAVTGQLTLPAFLFGLAVLCWVAGFDIIYACQDIDFDRQAKLHSIPAWLGVHGGLRISRGLHSCTVMLLIAIGFLLPHAAWPYWVAVTMVATMLVYEHRLVSPTDLSRVNEAFFRINGLISLGVFGLVVLNQIVS